MVAVGFKAKSSALFLVLLLSLFNVVVNNWWSVHAAHPQRDFLKYESVAASHRPRLTRQLLPDAFGDRRLPDVDRHRRGRAESRREEAELDVKMDKLACKVR